MKEIKAQIKEVAAAMLADLEKDTKAANARVRKATLTLAKLGKDFRKASIEAEKK